MKTVLLTASGSASAGPLLARYRALGFRVVCCDIYPRAWNVTSAEADAFFQAPLASDAGAYLAALEDAVRREKIDFLIPLTDVEVDLLCTERARFAALGCTLCVLPEPAARLCRSKSASAARLAEKGVCRTIPTRSPYGVDPESLAYPVILKPENGRSSQGKSVCRAPAEFAAARAAREDYVLQPFLEGPILLAETARDVFGNVRVLVREELLRTVNGLGTAVRVMPSHPLNAVCAAIAEELGIVGAVNIEFIAHDGDFYFLEVNPRFSGGVGFSLLAGADFAAWNLLCHSGKALPEMPHVREMILARRNDPVITEA